MHKIIGFILSATALYATQIIEITQEQQKSLGIKVQAASKIQYISLGSYNGEVIQSQKDRLSLSSKLDALVEEIDVAKFDHVKKGQRVMRLRSSTLLSLQNEYLESIIQKSYAEQNYKRDKKLEEKGVIAHKRLIESQTLYESSALALKLKENQLLINGMTKQMIERLKSTKEPLSRLDIYAPRSGVVYALDVSVGEHVNADKRVMEIYADATRYIEISVPASSAQSVSIGDFCEFDSHRAVVVSKSSFVDERSQSVRLRAEIADAKEVLMHHIYETKIVKNVSEYLKVSKSAVVFIDAKAFVFKKVATGFEVLDVEIISEGDSFYILNSRLTTDDLLAVSSTAALLGAREDSDE